MTVTYQDLYPRKRSRHRSGRFAPQPAEPTPEYQSSSPEVESGFVLPALPSIPTHRIVAAAIWFTGCIPTLFAVRRLFPGLGVYESMLATVMVQSMLTMLQSPIWRKVVERDGELVERQRSWINVVALVIDVVINFGSVITVTQRLHQLDGVQAIAATLGATATSISGVVLLVLTFILSAMLAAVPEKLWHRV